MIKYLRLRELHTIETGKRMLGKNRIFHKHVMLSLHVVERRNPSAEITSERYCFAFSQRPLPSPHMKDIKKRGFM
jgi:hypothetical protein